MRYCTVENCTKPYLTKGLCNMHRLRLARHGDINALRVRGENRHKNKLYALYTCMKARCYNKNNKSYKEYGGRGITVCDRWLGLTGFNNFLIDMGERPDKTTLDRIDVNGNYSPENCRWVSWRVQAINQRPKSTNKSGVPGVHWNKFSKQWVATISNGTKQLKWSFNSKKEAINARKKAYNKYYKPLMEIN